LRLLHPIVPFVTEEIWQLLAMAAPSRGLDQPTAAAASVMIAPWPAADERYRDERIEAQFARFQTALSGLREIRSRQNLPKKPITFSVRCDAATARLLEPMAPYFQSMAGASAKAWGPDAQAPVASAAFSAPGLEIFVDLAGLIDLDAEIARLEREQARLDGAIAAKQKQLANEKFVSRAPAEVIQKERESLAQLTEQRALVASRLETLRQEKRAGGG
jgi:valyl-tRNA synthetase